MAGLRLSPTQSLKSLCLVSTRPPLRQKPAPALAPTQRAGPLPKSLVPGTVLLVLGRLPVLFVHHPHLTLILASDLPCLRFCASQPVAGLSHPFSSLF